MWTIIRHDLQKTRSWVIFALFILLIYLFRTGINFGGVIKTNSNLSLAVFIISSIYSGIMFLNLYFSDQRQGSVFFLLSSPHSRAVIYWAKILTVLLPLIALLLLQILVIGYKAYSWQDFWTLEFLQSGLYAIYLSLANVLFLGSLCALLSQFVRRGLIRWLNVLIVAYIFGAFTKLMLLGAVGETQVVSLGSWFWTGLNFLFYQNLFFFPENSLLYINLFFLASLILFFLGSQIFIRRSFYTA